MHDCLASFGQFVDDVRLEIAAGRRDCAKLFVTRAIEQSRAEKLSADAGSASIWTAIWTRVGGGLRS